MSNLNPIQIDRYTLYLDRIVIVKINDVDPVFYDVQQVYDMVRDYKALLIAVAEWEQADKSETIEIP